MGFLGKIIDPLNITGLNDSSSDMPDYRLAELDPEISALKDKMMSRAERPAEEIANQRLEGTDKSGLLKSGLEQQVQSNRALGGANDESEAISKMISNKAAQNYSEALGNMQRRARLAAPIERFQRMSAAVGIQGQIANMESQLVEREYQNTMNRRAMRNATLGNILGIAGGIAGAAVGGPAGAQLGMSIGGGMGGNKNVSYMGEMGSGRGRY